MARRFRKSPVAGVIFHGHSGAGADYPPVVFASDGAEYATCDTIICDGLPALELSEDGTIVGRDKAEHYGCVVKSTRATLGAEPVPGMH